jgi:hypothetical protein
MRRSNLDVFPVDVDLPAVAHGLDRLGAIHWPH